MTERPDLTASELALIGSMLGTDDFVDATPLPDDYLERMLSMARKYLAQQSALDAAHAGTEVPKHCERGRADRWVLAQAVSEELPELAFYSEANELWFNRNGSSLDVEWWAELPEVTRG